MHPIQTLILYVLHITFLFRHNVAYWVYQTKVIGNAKTNDSKIKNENAAGEKMDCTTFTIITYIREEHHHQFSTPSSPY
jgi:hypothetical protein